MNDYTTFSTQDLIDALPENRPLYKDSGLWQVRSDNMEEVLFEQEVNESLREFIIRYHDSLRDDESVQVDLACKQIDSRNKTFGI